MRSLRVALLLLFFLPGVGRAADTTLVARDLPVAPARALSVAAAPAPFELVGLHWRGLGTVSFRTQSLAGRWSAWHPAAPEDEDVPDPRSAEARRRHGWRIGSPYWTGPSTRIEYRRAGRVSAVRAYFVRTQGGATPLRAVAVAGSPPIVARPGWGANEAIRRGAPEYADGVHFAIVHHTAGSNNYSPSQSAAIVRSIEAYHVLGNGWNDIGYNFLVDKYGRVFEGRYGGVQRAVVGAHAQGFNYGSVGVAVIGDYGKDQLSPAARNALVQLLAWRLDVAHVDPLSSVTRVSSGNPRYPAGRAVTLRGISGHRDSGPTSCPGGNLYALLGSIARDVAITGGPKIYDPSVRGDIGGPVRFTARLSSALVWSVTVKDASGNPVALGTGVGSTVDWTWDATSAPPGRYSYAIEAGVTVRPATGTLGRAVPELTLGEARAEPAIVTPNGDGVSDSTAIRFRLGAAAAVTVTATDQNGAVVSTIFKGRRAQGAQRVVWKPSLPDGRYRVVVTAQGTTKTLTVTLDVIVDRTLAAFRAAPQFFSPNGDGRLDTLTFSFALAGPAQVALDVLRGTQPVATPLAAALPAGHQQLVWDGKAPAGRLPDGPYRAAITATDALTTLRQTVPISVDTKPPQLAIVVARRLVFRLSEAAVVTLIVDGKRIVKAERAGRFHVPYSRLARSVSATAVDRAGNASRPVHFP